MKRRTFLSLSALSATPFSVRAADEDPSHAWYETIRRDELKWKAVSEQGDVVLEVELRLVTEEEVSEFKDERGEITSYGYKGKKMPDGFRPQCSMIKRFDLRWDGKEMHVPERFWNDLPDMRIHSSTLDMEKLSPEHQFAAREFLAELMQPRVSLSAEGGTVLIEWQRGEECDSRSTTRWVVSKSGTVLRHRHYPPHEC